MAPGGIVPTLDELEDDHASHGVGLDAGLPSADGLGRAGLDDAVAEGAVAEGVVPAGIEDH